MAATSSASAIRPRHLRRSRPAPGATREPAAGNRSGEAGRAMMAIAAAGTSRPAAALHTRRMGRAEIRITESGKRRGHAPIRWTIYFRAESARKIAGSRRISAGTRAKNAQSRGNCRPAMTAASQSLPLTGRMKMSRSEKTPAAACLTILGRRLSRPVCRPQPERLGESRAGGPRKSSRAIAGAKAWQLTGPIPICLAFWRNAQPPLVPAQVCLFSAGSGRAGK